MHHLLEALKGAEPRTQSLVSEIKVNALADSLSPRPSSTSAHRRG